MNHDKEAMIVKAGFGTFLSDFPAGTLIDFSDYLEDLMGDTKPMFTVHEIVARAVAENPHLAGSFDWSKLIQAVEAAIPVVMQIISLFHAPAPAPTPAPTPNPSH